MGAQASRRAVAFGLGVLLAVAGTGGARGADGLTYLVHRPANGPAHPPLVVVLHGSGADERDMIGLWPDLPASFVVVSPRAPFPDGAGGYRWYRAGRTREADIAVSRKIVASLLDDAAKRFDADPAKLFLAGFSQGAVMVYEVALHEPGRLRGAAVLSGSLFASATAGLPAGADRSRDDVFVAHGTADPRIPFASASAARDALARLGVPTAFHAYAGMGHAIGPAETRDLADWLAARGGTEAPGP